MTQLRERPPKLNNSERRILNELYCGDLSNVAVARVLGISTHSVSSYMAGLIRKGLVRKIGTDWRAV